MTHLTAARILIGEIPLGVGNDRINSGYLEPGFLPIVGTLLLLAITSVVRI